MASSKHGRLCLSPGDETFVRVSCERSEMENLRAVTGDEETRADSTESSWDEGGAEGAHVATVRLQLR